MNTRIVFPFALVPFAAAGLLVAAMAAANRVDSPTDAPASALIADLPAITVRPDAQDAAYFRMRRIVDLPRITVRPEPADLASLLADDTARLAHLPVSLPPAALLDRQMAATSALAAR